MTYSPPPLRSNPEVADAPSGSSEKKDAASSFGFRLDRNPGGNVALLRTPVVDVNFNERGFNALAFRGSVLHQNQPASGAPTPEINWWLVGGIAVGAVIAISNENKSKTSPAEPAKGKSF